MADAPLVLVGRVVKAHGIRGEVVVEPCSDVPGRLDAGVRVMLRGVPTLILGSRPHQGRLLVTLDGVVDRTAAELLRGSELHAEAVDLDTSDAYFVHELVGMVVRSDDGRNLGEVVAAIELPAAAGYDLLEVRRADGRTWLLPAVEDYVEVGDDTERGEHLVVVAPPDGLLDGALEGLDGPDAPGSGEDEAG